MSSNFYEELNNKHSAFFWEPHHLSHPAPWAGHIPFAFWLITTLKPKKFVELGAYSGISYLAFCQAIVQSKLDTCAWAVDSWEGDAHAGMYGENIYQSLKKAHDPYYQNFSNLLRMTFDEAVSKFEDKSIDLLHIDGLHTYEAVKHDFVTWFPKLTENAVVLFHDTNVYKDDFGVHKLWAEIEKKFPSINFLHSNGLGVILVGNSFPSEITEIFHPDKSTIVKKMFEVLGKRVELRADIISYENQIENLINENNDLRIGGEKRHEWIKKLDNDIVDLLKEKNKILKASDILSKENSKLVSENNYLIAKSQKTENELENVRHEINQVYSSRSWRMTAGYRYFGSFAKKVLKTQKIKRLARLAINGSKYILRGDFKGFSHRLKQINIDSRNQINTVETLEDGSNIGIIATHHTVYVAHLIQNSLKKLNIRSSIITDTTEVQVFDLSLYFVVCPQMFKNLPPGKKCISFQMEQGVSSRWFTSKYISVLENSLAVFDYSQSNFAYLKNKGIVYPHVFYVPIGGIPKYKDFLEERNLKVNSANVSEKYEVLFYGDVNAPRRKEMLDKLRKHFSVRVEGNLFGEALYQAMQSAKLVVNIHYYEGALLETTRIYECLSLGKPVVSEASTDQEQHKVLENRKAISFTPIGDADAMVEAVREKIHEIEEDGPSILESCQEVVQETSTNFDFMILRALYSLKLIRVSQWEKGTSDFSLHTNRLVLGMPETFERRKHFEDITAPRLGDIALFDGIRYSPGWLGCAMSYQFMARKALESGLPYLEISEDDVKLGEEYEKNKAIVMRWLSANEGSWDIFVGLIAKVHPKTRVLSVEEFEGLTFVTLDRMMSMVHNIYSKKGLEALATWDANDKDPESNTIDVFLQKTTDLKSVVVLPFLVAHEEEVNSSLWGFNNSQYVDMIENAQDELWKLVNSFKETHKNI